VSRLDYFFGPVRLYFSIPRAVCWWDPDSFVEVSGDVFVVRGPLEEHTKCRHLRVDAGGVQVVILLSPEAIVLEMLG